MRRSIEDRIKIQQEAVDTAKKRYDSEIEKLEKLMNKQDEENRKRIIDAFEKSNKTVEEIEEFLIGNMPESDKKSHRGRKKKDKIDQEIIPLK